MENSLITKKIGLVIGAVIFSLVIVFGGNDSFAGKKYGHLKYNPKVVPIFGSSDPLPADYNYFYSGAFYAPNAVIAIKKGINFDPNIWQTVDLKSEVFSKWRFLIESYNDMLNESYYGSNIIDPKGNHVGYWLSYERRAVILYTKSGALTIYTPQDKEIRTTP